MSGRYYDTSLSVQVQMPYKGDLTFDVSRSSPLTITSLYVVFGTTPIGSDTDSDGILVLQDTIPGVYTFTVIAEPGPSQRYDILVSCDEGENANPTESPSVAIQSTRS
eukprot:438992_1